MLSSSMAPSGIRSNAFYRSRWPTNYLYPPNQTIPSFDPYSLPPFWHGPSTGRYGQGTSISEDIKALTNYVNQFQAITRAQYRELGNRLSFLEKKDISPIINAEASEGVDNMAIPTGKTHFLWHLEVRGIRSIVRRFDGPTVR